MDFLSLSPASQDDFPVHRKSHVGKMSLETQRQAAPRSGRQKSGSITSRDSGVRGMPCDPRSVPSLSEHQSCHRYKGIPCVPITGGCESPEKYPVSSPEHRVWHVVTAQDWGAFNTHKGSITPSCQRSLRSGPPLWQI